MPDAAFWTRKLEEKMSKVRAREQRQEGRRKAVNQLTHQVVVEALKSVGVKEVGHNDGPEVREWLRRVGKKPGRAWCAALAWCKLDDACRALGLANPFPPTAGVHLMCQRAKQLHAWTAEPGPGFIGMHDSGVDQDTGAKLGHCGIVVEVGEHHALGVEGNTNELGSREGNAVVEKPRALGYWDLGYLDPSRLFTV